MRAFAAAAAVALCACGHAQVVHVPGETWVEAIEVHGNHAIDTDTILDGLALARARDEGGPFDPYELQLDQQRIVGLYARRGFLNAQVTPRVDARAGGGEVASFAIVEGPRAPLVRVELSGAPDDVPVQDLRAMIATRDGEPFDYDAYDDGRTAIAAALGDAGYAHASLDAQVIADRVHHEAVIRIAITAGPRCTFGDVAIAGTEGPVADAARARLAIHPGDTFSNKALADSQAALYDMGRFASARVIADRTRTDAVVPVEVKIVPLATRNEIRAGAGVGIDQVTYLLRPHVGYTRIDSPWPLWTLGVDLQPALALPRADLSSYEPRVQALVSLTRIDLWRPRLTGDIALGFQYLTVEAYSSTGPRLKLGLSSPLGRPELQVHAGWSIRQLYFVNINPAVDDASRARLRIDADERVAELDQSVSADFRDRPLEPTRGVYAALRVAEASRAYGSAFDLVQLAPDVRGYLPLGPIVLAAHARGGAILGDVPATDRYFSGGASAQRGFPERQLAPSVGGVVVGGGALIETGLEARAAVAQLYGYPVELAAFLDGGDVTETASELDPLHLHWAAGAGFRYVIKSIPIRGDFGYRLNRYGAGEPMPGERIAFHIGIGEAF